MRMGSVNMYKYCSVYCFIFVALIVVTNLMNNDVDASLLPANQTVPAVFVFGDSIVDPGNNNDLITVVKCNFPPYGRDFIGGKATGRFSNGKISSDFLAEVFGVKELLPAYLDPNLKLQDLLTGVSFATGGAGFDPLTAKLVSVPSLEDQMEMFKGSVEKMKAEVGGNRTAAMLSKSVFIVCTGSDDITNTYLSTPFRKIKYDISAYTDLMLKYATSFFQELYGLGARKIGVLSITALGCVPQRRTLSGGLHRHCSESANRAAMLFNSKLSSLLDSLSKDFLDAKFVFLDVYDPLITIIQNPAKYGFEVIDKGCCGTGTVEVGMFCNRMTLNICENADKYLFWDSYHPSQKAYDIINTMVMKKNIEKFF